MNASILKQLTSDSDIVRFAAIGKITRDGWTDHKEPLAEMFGEDIYRRKCLLSLNHAMYVDSTGVEWLLTTNQRFLEHGGMLILHSPTPASKQLLKTMRMDLVLNIVDDEKSALALATGKASAHAK